MPGQRKHARRGRPGGHSVHHKITQPTLQVYECRVHTRTLATKEQFAVMVHSGEGGTCRQLYLLVSTPTLAYSWLLRGRALAVLIRSAAVSTSHLIALTPSTRIFHHNDFQSVQFLRGVLRGRDSAHRHSYLLVYMVPCGGHMSPVSATARMRASPSQQACSPYPGHAPADMGDTTQRSGKAPAFPLRPIPIPGLLKPSKRYCHASVLRFLAEFPTPVGDAKPERPAFSSFILRLVYFQNRVSATQQKMHRPATPL